MEWAPQYSTQNCSGTQLDMDEDIFWLRLAQSSTGRGPGKRKPALLTEDELPPTRLNYLRQVRLASIHHGEVLKYGVCSYSVVHQPRKSMDAPAPSTDVRL
jgi:hypothetical protein